MVLRHASEKFRTAYELPLDNYELFGASNQFSDVVLDDLDEGSYRSDVLAKYDLWRKKNSTKATDELKDYKDLNEHFYDNDADDEEVPDYDDDDSQAPAILYRWHRDRHFDVNDIITKYVDDKM
jgi:hypothetical protein